MYPTILFLLLLLPGHRYYTPGEDPMSRHKTQLNEAEMASCAHIASMARSSVLMPCSVMLPPSSRSMFATSLRNPKGI